MSVAPTTKPRLVNLAWVIFTMLFVLSCGHTPVTSLYKLSKISPETTDLRKLRVAVQIPKTFQTTPKGVRLNLALVASKSAPTFNERFLLEQIKTTEGKRLKSSYAHGKRHFYIFKLAKTDIPRFERFRKIQAGGNGIKKRKGNMTIAAHVCRTTDVIPDQIILSTFLKTSETKEFVPLILHADILEELETANINEIAPRCKGIH
ncbi:MAG: hypothetical protein V3V04_06350 [Rhizobiaceae bacterium]